jgi:hypothetical protein
MSRELDREVAVAVFGEKAPKRKETLWIPDAYSSSIAAAWQVRAEMERRGWSSQDRLSWLGWGEDKHPYGYSIWFEKWERDEQGKLTGHKRCHHAHVDDHATAPEAICRAALAACLDEGNGQG